MSSFLEKINALTTERVAAAKQVISVHDLEQSSLYARAPRAVLPAFLSPGFHIIAEVKFASPSEGDIHPHAPQPEKIAGAYLAADARMLSVLTEPLYFKGGLDYLSTIRAAHPDALLLRKDFINDDYQLHEARAHGADAVLLIVAMTGLEKTRGLYQAARDLQLTVLMEVHDAAELEMAAHIGARMIGVNNRNLKTLKTDLDTSRQLATQKPAGSVFICESGLTQPQDVTRMHDIGYNGFLMGTHFMRSEKPGDMLARFMEGLGT